MQTLSETISRKIQEKCFFHQEWKNMKFVNHGLGIMRDSEHNELLKINAIVCNGKDDSVNCNYPKLLISTNNDERTVDTKGDMVALQGEKSNCENRGIKCKIEYYPKAYSDFYIKKKISEQKQYENSESINFLIKDFDGELVSK